MKLDKNIKQKLERIFSEQLVSLAYLFGSRATNQETDKSDVDVAVLLSGSLPKERRFEIRLNLMNQLNKIFKRNVDLVIINDVSSLFFKYVIIKEGKLIYSRSDLQRVNFESQIFSLYFDFQPFLDLYSQNYVKSGIQ